MANVKRGDSFLDLLLTLSRIIVLSLAILQFKGNFERFIERLHSFDIGKAKATVPSFKNLPDKFSIPAAFFGLVSLSNFKTSSSKVGKKVKVWFSVFKNRLY